MRARLKPLSGVERQWKHATDIETALFANLEDSASAAAFAEQAQAVRSALQRLPNAGVELKNLCAALDKFAGQADGFAQRPEGSAAREQLRGYFNSLLERVYDWADGNDVWLGI